MRKHQVIILIMWAPEGEQKERGRKNIHKNNGPKLPKSDGIYESMHSRSSINSKQNKFKKDLQWNT